MQSEAAGGEHPGERLEQRESKRVRSRLAVRYRVKGEDADVGSAATVDVSTGGLAFDSSRLVPIGARVLLEIAIPPLVDILRAEARVKWAQELEIDQKYRHGLQFVAMQDADRLALDGYLRSIDIERILRLGTQKHASDIHLVADRPPVFRLDGDLNSLDMDPIPARDLERMILGLMTDRQREMFERDLELDFSFTVFGGARFRANVHLDKGQVAAALRLIPTQVRTLTELGLPPILEELTKRRRGLIIVTGPSGSGKSTTLAAMVDMINQRRRCMIISIEDPIEYIYSQGKSVIKQREVGVDTLSFSSALKHVLRQDPNVILIGEIRDLDSISMAMTAAETGHLMLTSLHTPSAVECINRIVDVYPSSQQNQIRAQLAGCLEAVVGQLLLPRRDGAGMTIATEVLIGTPAVRNLIRQGALDQVSMYMDSGAKYGMQSMDRSLAELLEKGIIDRDTAKAFAKDPSKLPA